MFQDYALFPHMTVAENVEYGLRVRKVARAERRERAPSALEMVRLADLGGRKPVQLSGGQRQRVALARAIVNEPEVLLLDEPLGALDLKLRQEMQIELKRIQREVGITFVYVTHDQEEALTMSDRIAVMDRRPHRTGRHADRHLRAARPPSSSRASSASRTSSSATDAGSRSGPRRCTCLFDDDAAPAGAHVEPGVITDVIYLGVVTRYVVALDGWRRSRRGAPEPRDGCRRALESQGAACACRVAPRSGLRDREQHGP